MPAQRSKKKKIALQIYIKGNKGRVGCWVKWHSLLPPYRLFLPTFFFRDSEEFSISKETSLVSNGDLLYSIIFVTFFPYVFSLAILITRSLTIRKLLFVWPESSKLWWFLAAFDPKSNSHLVSSPKPQKLPLIIIQVHFLWSFHVFLFNVNSELGFRN